MGDKEDVERRKQLSNAALYKLKNIWIGKDKINRNIKIKLYKALVKSILTYNCGTWALAQTEQIQDNLSLKSTDDLKYLRSLAQDRDQRKSLTKQIVEIAEASRSDDQDAKSE